jgi:Ca2+-binding RTX toxin-like protein
MATFSVLNGTGMNGAGIQFGSLGTQIVTSGIAGFPIITPTTGNIFYNDTGLFSLSGTSMSFVFPNTFGGTVTSLSYSKPAATPVFSISAFTEELGDIAGLFMGGNGMSALADIFSEADTITGSTQNDILQGFAGADVLNGGAGNDTVSYSASSDGVIVDLGISGPQLSLGDAFGDTLTDIENLRGSIFVDTLIGNAAWAWESLPSITASAISSRRSGVRRAFL